MSAEDPRISGAKLRDYYRSLGLIIPADQWRHELEEYEQDRNTRNRRPGGSHLRLVHSGAGNGRA